MSDKLPSGKHQDREGESSDAVVRDEIASLRKELRGFAHIVSHDFRVPLRHTKEFTRILLEKLEGLVSEEDREIATMIRDSVIRSEQMLDGLLSYSRLISNDHPKIRFSASEALESALTKLATALVESNGKVSVEGNLPEVFGSFQLSEQLFFHFLDNAIKFRSTDSDLRIHISVQEQGDFTLIVVADNGIGLERARPELAFDQFKKLHSDSVYSGVGMGLTLSKVIVETHYGGKIWLEARREGGSSLSFTIPVTQPEQCLKLN